MTRNLAQWAKCKYTRFLFGRARTSVITAMTRIIFVKSSLSYCFDPRVTYDRATRSGAESPSLVIRPLISHTLVTLGRFAGRPFRFCPFPEFAHRRVPGGVRYFIFFPPDVRAKHVHCDPNDFWCFPITPRPPGEVIEWDPPPRPPPVLANSSSPDHTPPAPRYTFTHTSYACINTIIRIDGIGVIVEPHDNTVCSPRPITDTKRYQRITGRDVGNAVKSRRVSPFASIDVWVVLLFGLQSKRLYCSFVCRTRWIRIDSETNRQTARTASTRYGHIRRFFSSTTALVTCTHVYSRRPWKGFRVLIGARLCMPSSKLYTTLTVIPLSWREISTHKMTAET